MKIKNDKYYTSPELVDYVISKTYEIIIKSNISQIIEPSAGNGAFSSKLDCIAYDLHPESNDIIKQDFLELEIDYKKGRLVIGNPPFGNKGHLMQRFCDKSFEIADYVSFILPANQHNNISTINKFGLLYSEHLGIHSLSGYPVNCCLNIYSRYCKVTLPVISSIITIKEIRRTRKYSDFTYDFAIRAWGKIGKLCEPYEYAKVFCITINDFDNYEYYKNLILNADWCNLYHMTGTPNLLQWQVIKYIEDNKIETKRT